MADRQHVRESRQAGSHIQSPSVRLSLTHRDSRSDRDACVALHQSFRSRKLSALNYLVYCLFARRRLPFLWLLPLVRLDTPAIRSPHGHVLTTETLVAVNGNARVLDLHVEVPPRPWPRTQVAAGTRNAEAQRLLLTFGAGVANDLLPISRRVTPSPAEPYAYVRLQRPAFVSVAVLSCSVTRRRLPGSWTSQSATARSSRLPRYVFHRLTQANAGTARYRPARACAVPSILSSLGEHTGST